MLLIYDLIFIQFEHHLLHLPHLVSVNFQSRNQQLLRVYFNIQEILEKQDTRLMVKVLSHLKCFGSAAQYM